MLTLLYCQFDLATSDNRTSVVNRWEMNARCPGRQRMAGMARLEVMRIGMVSKLQAARETAARHFRASATPPQ